MFPLAAAPPPNILRAPGNWSAGVHGSVVGSKSSSAWRTTARAALLTPLVMLLDATWTTFKKPGSGTHTPDAVGKEHGAPLDVPGWAMRPTTLGGGVAVYGDDYDGVAGMPVGDDAWARRVVRTATTLTQAADVRQMAAAVCGVEVHDAEMPVIAAATLPPHGATATVALTPSAWTAHTAGMRSLVRVTTGALPTATVPRPRRTDAAASGAERAEQDNKQHGTQPVAGDRLGTAALGDAPVGAGAGRISREARTGGTPRPRHPAAVGPTSVDPPRLG